jgi:hypothetical protein
MAIPTSKPLSLSAVQTEFGGSNPISMSEYRGEGRAPATGAIDLWADFNGTSSIISVVDGEARRNYASDSSTFSPENTTDSAAFASDVTKYNPPETVAGETIYVKNDTVAWAGNTISNLGASKVAICYSRADYDADLAYGGPGFTSSRWELWPVNSSGSIFNNNCRWVELANDENLSADQDRTTNLDLSTYMTDGEIQTWISEGCPCRLKASGESNNTNIGAQDINFLKIELPDFDHAP